MEWTIYECGKPVGQMCAEREGLFWAFHCRLFKLTEQLRRIYVLSLWRTEYLGIADTNGLLDRRIAASHFPDGVTGAVASGFRRNEWQPWRGVAGGVSVDEGYLRADTDGMTLALPPEQALRFPAWFERMETTTVLDREMHLLPLDRAGNSLLRETEIGGITNEEQVETQDCGLPASDNAVDPSAVADIGGGEQADCPDL